MKNVIFKSIFCLLISNIFLAQFVHSQDNSNLWTFGIGVNVVKFHPKDLPITDDENFITESNSNFGGPQILISRHLVKNLSIEGLLSFNQISNYGDIKIEKSTYTGFDFNLKYSVMDPSQDFTIFALAGAGYTSFNPETVWVEGTPIKFGSGGSFNLGGGLNYWISDTIGLNYEALYKISISDKLSSNFYNGLSLVFRLKQGKSFNWRDGK